MIIALDAMGGDAAPDIVIGGVRKALAQGLKAKFLLFGDEAQLVPSIRKDKLLAQACTIEHAPTHVPMDMPPVQAVRHGRKDSSMARAIETVKTGQAQCIISAGNTGALMALATLILRPLPDITRPAIAALWPTMRGESVVLDMGATIGGSVEQYLQFAVLGESYASERFGIKSPSIGLLNVGNEEMKGTEDLREAARQLSASPLNFVGFVEGNDILEGKVDVVVTDGFTGNIALKTAEGTAKLIAQYLRDAFRSGLAARLGYLFAFFAMRRLRTQLRPTPGGVFLGIKGIVVKCHGGANAHGFAASIAIAHKLASADLLAHIQRDMQALSAAALAETK